MQYSLLNRFRGLFLGVAALESRLQINVLGEGQRSVFAQPGNPQSPLKKIGWSHEITTSIQALMASESLIPIPIPTFLGQEDEIAREIARILPLALFWHDNLPQWQQRVYEQLLPGAEPDLQAGVLGIGGAISTICTEKVSSQHFIPYLLQQDWIRGTALQAQLSQVQAQLQNHASLMTVLSQLNPDKQTDASPLTSAIAMAFYCWLSTPDSFALTLSRTLTLPYPSRLTALIASALSGLSNGMSGISLHWQQALLASKPSQLSRQGSLAQADQLLTFWSGSYDQQQSFSLPTQLEQTALSAPGVLRPR